MYNIGKQRDFDKAKIIIEEQIKIIRDQTNTFSSNRTLDIPSQIKKLAELKDSGITSEAEIIIKNVMTLLINKISHLRTTAQNRLFLSYIGKKLEN